MAMIDIIHANSDKMKLTEALTALKPLGIKTPNFFMQKYRCSFEEWVTKFPHYVSCTSGFLVLELASKYPPQPPVVIGKKKREKVSYILADKWMLNNGGQAPNISQFLALCRDEMRLDLLHFHSQLRLTNPSFAIQWLLGSDVELRQVMSVQKKMTKGVYPLHPPSLLRKLTLSPSTSHSLNNTDSDSDHSDKHEESDTESDENESGLNRHNVGEETLSHTQHAQALIHTQHTQHAQALTAAPVLTKGQIPPGVDFSLYFDHLQQAIYGNVDSAKILPRRSPADDEEVLLVLSRLPETYSNAIFEKIVNHPSFLHAIIMDQGSEVLLRYADKSQDNVEGIEVDLQFVVEYLFQKIRSEEEQVPSIGAQQPFKLNKGMLSDAFVSVNARMEIYNLTLCVSRFVPSAAHMIYDIVSSLSGNGDKRPKSLLVVGAPGSGKTTLLCEIARQLSKQKDKNVRLVDRNHELGGDGVSAHPRVGAARRQRSNLRFSELVREAIQSHHADVLVVDGVSDYEETMAVCAAVRRGVTVIASVSAHCATLRTLVEDEELSPLACNDPLKGVFDILHTNAHKVSLIELDKAVELVKVNSFHVHHNLRHTVAAIRLGKQCSVEKRWVSETTSAILARQTLN